MYKIRTIILELSAVLLMISCQYKDFDDYAGTLKVPVVADYSNAECSTIPAVTRAIFYPFYGSEQPFVYDLRDSVYVNLPTGTFTVFAYNNDSQINRTRSYEYKEGSPVLFTGLADMRGLFQKDSLDHTGYYDYPDSTYCYYGTATISGMPETTDSTSNRIVLRMKKITRLVDIKVHGIKNTEYIKSVRFSLDGLNLEYSPKGLYPNTKVSIAADGGISSNGELASKFTIFGASEAGHILGIHMFTGYYHKVLWCDVTDIVNSQLSGSKPIIIDINVDYDVKDDIPESRPFDVGVEDWKQENISIDM